MHQDISKGDQMHTARFSALAASLTLLCALLTPSSPASAGTRVQFVHFEGCVVDGSFRPVVGRSVTAVSTSGAVLATGRTDAVGEFRIRVPASATFRVSYANVSTPDFRSDDRDVWVSYCFQQQQD